MATLEKPSDIRQEIGEVVDKMQAMVDRAKAEDRDFTPIENERFSEYETSLIPLKKKLGQAEAHRDKMLAAAEAQTLLADTNSTAGIPGTHFGATKRMIATPQSRLATKLKTFTGANALADAAAAGQFIKSVIDGSIRNTMTEGSPSGGGYTVPTPLGNAIIDKRENVGISRQTAMVLPMTADTLSVPKLLSGPAVSYIGEGSAISPTDQTWGQIQLTAKKRAVLVKISNELLGDSVVNLAEYVTSRAAFELAKQEDREFILGDGTSTYGNEVGLLSSLGTAGVSDCASGHDTWVEIDMADMTACMGKLPSDYGDNTSWICSPQFYYSVMLRLLASAGGNDILTLEAGGGTRPTFLGRPVYLTSAMPTSSAASTISALYGVFNEAAAIGDRVALEVAVSGDRYFDEYCTALRVIARYDINCHETGDSNVAGAVVGLKTAAS